MPTWNNHSFTDVRRLVREALDAEPLPEGWTLYMRWTNASRGGFGHGQNRGAFGQVEVACYARAQHISRTVGRRIHGDQERKSGKGWAAREAVDFVAAIRAEAVAGEAAYQALRRSLQASLADRKMLRAALNVTAAELELDRWTVATGDYNVDTSIRWALRNAKESLNKGIKALDRLETAADG